MKNSIKFIVLVCILFSIWGCKNEDIVVRYPNSTPKIDTAVVKETQITYGDSIHVRVAVSDKVAPLSTLLLQVVCNNQIVTSETIRTKGNSSSIARTYGVPFVGNRPDNAAVKIYLTETNVSGITRDSIVSTTIAKRPVITDLYIVPDYGEGATAKMTLVNADSLIYKVTGLLYANSFKYKIATKIDKFKRIDYTGLVFGITDATKGTIGLVTSKGLSIDGTNAKLVGVSIITFDALQFTTKVGGKLLEPATTLDVIADLPLNPVSLKTNTNFRGGNIYFGEGVEVTFTGITNLENNLSPDYFQVTGPTTAKFLGKTGLYKAYYLTTTGYLYIEPQPEAVYPDVLWICGNNFGRPQSPYTTTSSWNWNSPLDYAPCRPIADGVYQVTIYAENGIGVTDGFGTFNFKFFDQQGWTGSEETSTNFTVSLPLVSRTDVNNVGNVSGSPTAFKNVIQITLNKNDKTIKAVILK